MKRYVVSEYFNCMCRIFTEAGLEFDYKSLANGDLLPKLWKASPISYIDNVRDLNYGGGGVYHL